MIPRPEGFKDYTLMDGEAEATFSLGPEMGELTYRERMLMERAFRLGVKAGRELTKKPWPGQTRQTRR